LSTSPFYVVTLSTQVSSPASIPEFRTQLRNAIDHLRRRHPLWRDLSLNLWLTRTNQLRGVVALGTLGSQEVCEKLGTHWPVTLRRIEAEDLRVEVYSVLRRVWAGETEGRRYQPLSLLVGPRRIRMVPECQNVLTHAADEPMPVLI
jgi:hypothetical protein